jgi:rRNA processing protein Krr1/Pno1
VNLISQTVSIEKALKIEKKKRVNINVVDIKKYSVKSVAMEEFTMTMV